MSNLIRWEPEEIQFLKENYPHKDARAISEHLSRSAAAIRQMARKLKLSKSAKVWTDQDIQYLRDNYPTSDFEDLLANLDHSWESIKQKARDLKIKRGISAEDLLHIKKIIQERYEWDSMESLIRDTGLSENRIRHHAYSMGIRRLPGSLNKRFQKEFNNKKTD